MCLFFNSIESSAHTSVKWYIYLLYDLQVMLTIFCMGTKKGTNHMSAMVFVNLPVSDVEKSTEFYEKLGFKKNEEFSTEETSSMMWDDHFWIMLLSHEFYGNFIRDKKIIDARTTSGTLISFNLESADEVKKFGEIAKANGGDYYRVAMGIPDDQMYGLEVQDLDGNTLEPVWMNI